MVIVYGDGFGNAPVKRGCIERAVVIKDAKHACYEINKALGVAFLVIYGTSEMKTLHAQFVLSKIIGYEIREDKEEA